MARWLGKEHSEQVLAAADAWRERCFLRDGSVFTDRTLWTAENIGLVSGHLVGNPIEGSDRNYYDKLKEQLDGASAEVIQLVAEMTWLLDLFPGDTTIKAETKRRHVKDVWGWSGADLPESPYLADRALAGAGHPGTRYLTTRYEQMAFLVDVIGQWKGLTDAERNQLFANNAPWDFVEWFDKIDNAEARPVRNALLFFIYPDELERNISNTHRQQIVYALKYLLPPNLMPAAAIDATPLRVLDRAINYFRKYFEAEFETKELDFYGAPLASMWRTEEIEKARKEVAAELRPILSGYGLELNECGGKKKYGQDYFDLDAETGFWSDPNEATNKPPRLIFHLERDGNKKLVASVPKFPGAKRFAYANTAQGKSGAIIQRAIPAIKLADDRWAVFESWEWLILLCFYPNLDPGSSGQLFEEFDVDTGKLVYLGKKQAYVAAALICLNEPTDLFVADQVSPHVTYNEATDAIARLISVAPTVPEAP